MLYAEIRDILHPFMQIPAVDSACLELRRVVLFCFAHVLFSFSLAICKITQNTLLHTQWRNLQNHWIETEIAAKAKEKLQVRPTLSSPCLSLSLSLYLCASTCLRVHADELIFLAFMSVRDLDAGARQRHAGILEPLWAPPP